MIYNISFILFIIDCQCFFLSDLLAACVKNRPDAQTIAADSEPAAAAHSV